MISQALSSVQFIHGPLRYLSYVIQCILLDAEDFVLQRHETPCGICVVIFLMSLLFICHYFLCIVIPCVSLFSYIKSLHIPRTLAFLFIMHHSFSHIISLTLLFSHVSLSSLADLAVFSHASLFLLRHYYSSKFALCYSISNFNDIINI